MTDKTKKYSLRKNTRFSAVDLFCGCGGLSTGLKKAGFNVLGAVDIDLTAIEVYKANHPYVQIWESDIRLLSPDVLLESLCIKRGDLELLAGCPPCQGFSQMRTKNGKLTIDDPRNNLLLDFQCFVEIFLPRAIMLENVPGLAKEPIFLSFIDKMSALGYVGDFRILNAAEYGVPQRRYRLIYMAALGEKIPFAYPRKDKKTVRDAIGALPKAGKSGDPLHDLPEHRTARVAELIRSIPKNGGSRSALSKEMQLKCHQNCSGYKDVYGRMSWEDVAPTITGGCFNPSKGRFLHPEEDRAITLREAALLQGFPPHYKFSLNGGKCAVALLIGNALPPPLITAHAKEISRVLIKNHKQEKTS